VNGDVIDALRRTRRLEELGLLVQSRELASRAKEISAFWARGGNRRMRRAAAKAARRRKP
jgi:ribosomal protein S8E